MRASALAALLAAAALPALADLGTLFFTPAERARLDQERRGEPVEQASASPRAPVGHAITGFVERSDGRGIVWIDGRPLAVSGATAKRAFDPSKVRAYSRGADEVKIEREPGR